MNTSISTDEDSCSTTSSSTSSRDAGVGVGAGVTEAYEEGVKREIQGLSPTSIGNNGANIISFSLCDTLSTLDAAQIMDSSFDVLSIDKDDFREIHAASVAVIKHAVGVSLQEINVDESVFLRFAHRIGTLYQETPYHNFHHAFCVVRETAMLLQLSGTKDSFKHKDVFVMLIAALVHDVDHSGTNNDFEVKSSSRLALLYNDNSVLENHHLAPTFNVLLDKQYNIFERWSEEEKRRSRKVITKAILSTDMAVHKSLQEMMQSRSHLTPAAFNLSEEEDKEDMLRILLHTADIFNAARPFEVSSRISKFVVEEFRNQVKKETELGLPITPWMDMKDEISMCKGELGFTTFVARPYFDLLAKCFPDRPCINFVPAIDANIEAWKMRIQELEEGQ